MVHSKFRTVVTLRRGKRQLKSEMSGPVVTGPVDEMGTHGGKAGPWTGDARSFRGLGS